MHRLSRFTLFGKSYSIYIFTDLLSRP